MERITVLPRDLRTGSPTQFLMTLGHTQVVESCTVTSELAGKMFLQSPLVVAVLQGTFSYSTEGSAVTVAANQCAVIDGGRLVEYVKQGGASGACHLINFFFDRRVVADFLAEMPLGATPAERPSGAFQVDSRLGAYLQAILTYLHQPSKLPDGFLAAKQKELLFLLQSLRPGVLGTLVPEGAGKLPLQKAVLDRLSHPLTLAEWASLTGRSVSGLKRDFLAEFGMPPMRWLWQARLEKAKTLLERTDKPLVEIGLQCGFQNVSHFSRKFRDQFGFPPSQVRNRAFSEA